MRVERDAGQHSFVAYGLHHAMQVGTSLIVYIHHVRPEGFHLRDELFGRYNHQMHIQRLACVSGHGLHHRKTETNVGHKHPIHHIQMVPIGRTFVEHFDVALQIGEIRTEQRRRDHCHESVG